MYPAALLLVAAVVALLLLSSHSPPAAGVPAPASKPVGAYVLAQMDDFAGHYWARVAGEDDNAPPKVNGHDEFAAQWLREMQANLRGLPLAVFAQPFPTPGFQHYVGANRPGVNHIILVPGALDPSRTVVVVAHYDGEPFSKGSAYDDTSGAAVMLGVAQAMGAVWRSSGLPALSVEFVLFDGEEQGLVGSGAYLFDLRHSALMPQPAALIDEEQTGVGYPARPFGLASKAPMPAFATTTKLSKQLTKAFGPVQKPSPHVLHLMSDRLKAARGEAFRQLRSAYGRLRFRDGSREAFTHADEKYLLIGANPVCCSDNAPFEALGLPTAMFSGDASYYHRGHPVWAYPFDQPQDTPSTLACDTGGSPTASKALEAALALPVYLTDGLLRDYAPPHSGQRLAAIGGIAIKGRITQFAVASFTKPAWSFGDGGHATGRMVHHVYKRRGVFNVTVSAGHMSLRMSVHVHGKQPIYSAPFGRLPPPPLRPFHPRQLKGISGCP